MSDPVHAIYSPDAEQAVLGCCLAQSAEVIPKAADALLRSDFFVPAHQEVFTAVCAIFASGSPVDVMTVHHWLTDRKLAEAVGSPGILAELLTSFATHLNVGSYIDIVSREAARRRAIVNAQESIRVALEEPEKFLPDAKPSVLDARRFVLTSPPAPARSIYRIGSATIATPGNLVVIAAQAKAGKSALVGALIAAATGVHGDTLGIKSGNPDDFGLIHFDTEQSPADHHALVATALRRVGVIEQPTWLRSYRMVDVPLNERLGLLEHELDRARREHGGIHSLLLDGVADFVIDVNDSAEAFGVVEKLHRLAVKYDTNIVCVLHFNPGTDFSKTRGHLGSQLERKAETNLALEKIDGVTVVYTKMARHAHVEKDGGSRFQWDPEAGMHLSIESLQEEKAASDDFHNRATADEAFMSKPSMRYSDLKAEIMRIRQVKERRAEDIIRALVPKLIKKNVMGFYERLTP
jgi:hypothetical protein